MYGQHIVLWSGGNRAKEKAVEFAICNGMTTLELNYPWLEKWAETVSANVARDNPGLDSSVIYNEYVRPVFDCYSSRFVEMIPQDQTEVYIVIDKKAYKERRSYHYRDSRAILHNTEHPQLKRAGKTIHVIMV